MDVPSSIYPVESRPEDHSDQKMSLEDRQEAFSQMQKDATFIKKLVLTAQRQAELFGLADPFSGGTIVEWHTAEDIAWEVVTGALAGERRWNRQKFPSFYVFCKLQIRSVISNTLEKLGNRYLSIESPIPEENPETGDFTGTKVSEPEDTKSLSEFLMSREGDRLADSFLQDFALLLPENSIEQRIVMKVLDDKACTEHTYCTKALGLERKTYDAALKRIERTLPGFRETWISKNGLTAEDWRNLR